MSDSSETPFSGAYWVEPGKLMAGPYPGTWNEDHTRNRLQRLLDAGVTFFVDLTPPRELQPYEPLLPVPAPYRRFPIPDMRIPSDELMVQILDTIDAAIADGQTVYVHCWGGVGRTGTVIGCWLVRHGMTGEAALDEVVRLRDGRQDAPQTGQQADMVRRWRPGQ